MAVLLYGRVLGGFGVLFSCRQLAGLGQRFRHEERDEKDEEDVYGCQNVKDVHDLTRRFGDVARDDGT